MDHPDRRRAVTPRRQQARVVVGNRPAGITKTTISRRLIASGPSTTCIARNSLRGVIVTTRTVSVHA